MDRIFTFLFSSFLFTEFQLKACRADNAQETFNVSLGVVII